MTLPRHPCHERRIDVHPQGWRARLGDRPALPEPGRWTVEEYLDLSNRNQLVEYSQGFVEVLPRPSLTHQLILQFLCLALRQHVIERDLGGMVLFAPYCVRVNQATYREPDLIYLGRARAERAGERFSEGADLVMEIVSESNRSHDPEKKRAEYAEAGIQECWIIDSQRDRILVLILESGETSYVEHGEFGKGGRATSRLLPGFSVDVADALAPRV